MKLVLVVWNYMFGRVNAELQLCRYFHDFIVVEKPLTNKPRNPARTENRAVHSKRGAVANQMRARTENGAVCLRPVLIIYVIAAFSLKQEKQNRSNSVAAITYKIYDGN